MNLRERARDAFWAVANQRQEKRERQVRNVAAKAVKAAAAMGLETRAEDWKDWGNVEPNRVWAEIDGLEILFDHSEGFSTRPRGDLGFESFSSLAELGELLDNHLPGNQRWRSQTEHDDV